MLRETSERTSERKIYGRAESDKNVFSIYTQLRREAAYVAASGTYCDEVSMRSIASQHDSGETPIRVSRLSKYCGNAPRDDKKKITRSHEMRVLRNYANMEKFESKKMSNRI